MLLIRTNAHVTAEQLGITLGISKRAVLKHIHALKNKKRLERVGPANGGSWKVMGDGK